MQQRERVRTCKQQTDTKEEETSMILFFCLFSLLYKKLRVFVWYPSKLKRGPFSNFDVVFSNLGSSRLTYLVPEKMGGFPSALNLFLSLTWWVGLAYCLMAEPICFDMFWRALRAAAPEAKRSSVLTIS